MSYSKIIFIEKNYLNRREEDMWHTGKHEYQLDSKNRMRLPASSRTEYGDVFYLSIDMDGSLLVRHKNDMEKMSLKLAEVSMSDKAAQNAIRWFYEKTYEVKQDEQGRFVLPQELKDYAKINKNIIISGVPRGWSIRSEENYNNIEAAAEEYKEFDDVVKKLQEYGV